MKLRCFVPSLPLGCARVYVRVDWNIPLGDGLAEEDSLKLTRSYALLEQLRQAQAVTLVLTHLGRPKKREAKYSTKPLAKLVAKHSGLPIQYLNTDLSTEKGRAAFARDIDQFQPGDIVLLENVRFQKGEETGSAELLHAYAIHADAFINDAFASCHRTHVSVTGLAGALPSYAGPSLCTEIDALSRLLKKPKKPYLAVIGGAKLTTKIPVLQTLLKTADTVLVGGAMAHAFFAAQKQPIGKSFIERGAIPAARTLLKNKRLVLPTDVVVTSGKPAVGARLRAVSLTDIKKTDTIVDIGPATMRDWASRIKKAKTVVWNGPVGMAEVPAFAHGSLIVGAAIAARAKGPSYGVAGGGDTLPVVQRTGMQEWFDFISTGGGAMLEFLASGGELPGVSVLSGSQQKKLCPPFPSSAEERGISCAPILFPNKTTRKKKG